MKAKMKGVAVAAVVAMISFSPAKADAVSDSAISGSLGLLDFGKAFGSNFFQSSITTGAGFLSALTGVANTYTYGQIVEAFVNFGNSKVPGSLSTDTFTGAFNVGPGYSWVAALNFNSTTGTINLTGGVSGEVVPVPGPEAGAGLGALAMAGMAYVAMRRRKQQLAA